MANPVHSCALCQKGIENYSVELNSLDLGEKRADLCQDCIDRFLKWQQRNFSRMFPTSFAKKRRFG